jgi:hypothetical protein
MLRALGDDEVGTVTRGVVRGFLVGLADTMPEVNAIPKPANPRVPKALRRSINWFSVDCGVSSKSGKIMARRK